MKRSIVVVAGLLALAVCGCSNQPEKAATASPAPVVAEKAGCCADDAACCGDDAACCAEEKVSAEESKKP